MTGWPYLGPLGGLVQVTAPGWADTVETVRPASTQVTIGGRVLAQMGPRAHRSRAITLHPSTPSEVATLAGFVEGEHGPGPFWWVDPWAQVTNALPARASLLLDPWPGASAGGSVVLDDGARAGRSLVVSGAQAAYLSADGAVLRLPAVAGVPVCASAWLSGADVVLRLEAVSAAGVVVASVSATGRAGWGRASVVLAPAAGVHHLRLAVSGTGRIARPSVTFTNQPTEWGVGLGAPAVVVTGLSQQAVPTAGLGTWYAGGGFQIVEVG